MLSFHDCANDRLFRVAVAVNVAVKVSVNVADRSRLSELH
jgi:hypothetical protein